MSTAVGGHVKVTSAQRRSYDVVVIGAGVFGMWSAYKLHMAGRRVAVVDAVGPAHSRASSGGESRVTRFGYGEDRVYSEWAWRSISDWQALSAQTGLPIFHQMGVLWVHTDPDELVQASARVLLQYDIPFTVLSARDLRGQFPVMRVDDGEAGFLEPRGGALMARRAVQFLAADLVANGVTFLTGSVSPIRQEQGNRGTLAAVTTARGRTVRFRLWSVVGSNVPRRDDGSTIRYSARGILFFRRCWCDRKPACLGRPAILWFSDP